MTRAVVALGGNALLGPEESPTIESQRANAKETISAVSSLRKRYDELVFTHGNGPQVGARLLEQEAADGPSAPLDVLVAETQAQIGYLVAAEFDRAFDGQTVSLVTRVLVDPDDPAFDDPAKPIGPYYDEAEAADREFEVAADTTPEGETAFRRVVPSPRPIEVVEADRIRTLVDAGATVICGGGGGVPMIATDGTRSGVAAVVDKDYTARLVAEAVDATALVMVTDVPCAYRSFGSPDQSPIREASPETVRELLDTGEFGEGSMAPKMEACASFVDGGGDRAVIGNAETLDAALAGDAGTTIVE